MKKFAFLLTLTAAACFAQYQILTNTGIVDMVRKGVPLASILQTIKTAPEVDFLINSYEIGRLIDAGATDQASRQIMDAIHQRQLHPPRPTPAYQAVYTEPGVRGPELGNPLPPERLTLRRPGPRIVLDDATPVKLRIARNLSSADAKTGETVDFEVLEDVKVADFIVIGKGATAIGSVTNAEAKKRMARGGKLDVMIEFVKLADGEKAALRGVKELKGGGHTAGMTTGIVVTGLVFWPAAPMFLFIQGKDITIPKGTEITAYTNGNMTLDGGQFRYEARAE